MRKGKNGPSRFSYEILNALMNLDQRNDYHVLIHPEWKGDINFKPRFVPHYTKTSMVSPLDFLKIYFLSRHIKASIYFSSTFMTPMITGTHKRVATVYDLINITLPEYFEGYGKVYACLAKAYLRFRTWLTAKSSDKIVTVSKYSREQIVKYYSMDPNGVLVIYNGVGDRLGAKGLSQNMRQRFSIDRPYILGLANFRGYKNIKVLLRAYAELRKNGLKELLVLFGRCPNALAKKTIMDFLGSDVGKDVRLLGYLNDDELSEIYTGASVFVFPSLAEGFGIPAAEAMACGTCVITSDVGSMREVCGDAALYLNPRDPVQLASVIRKVIEMSGCYRPLISKGIERARNYSWGESAQKLIRMFETL